MGKVDLNGLIFALALVCAVMLLHGCATKQPEPPPVAEYIPIPTSRPLPNFCEVQTAYRPPAPELQHVAKAPYTTDYLLKTNTFGKEVCGWKENSK